MSYSSTSSTKPTFLQYHDNFTFTGQKSKQNVQQFSLLHLRISGLPLYRLKYLVKPLDPGLVSLKQLELCRELRQLQILILYFQLDQYH